jgi:hypothetical protein
MAMTANAVGSPGGVKGNIHTTTQPKLLDRLAFAVQWMRSEVVNVGFSVVLQAGFGVLCGSI